MLRIAMVCAMGVLIPAAPAARADNFTTAADAAATRFGVHEVMLGGDGTDANPFDTIATVTFVPPSGQTNAKTVHAFYDGDKTWRARVYVSETGDWQWLSSCATDKGLDARGGTFKAGGSKLRGRLLPHPKNPRQWMTEDGRWFLNLSDTAYYLLSSHTATGDAIPEEDMKAYVHDAVAHGITSVRCSGLIGKGDIMDHGKNAAQRPQDSGSAGEPAFSRMPLPEFRGADERLRWMLNAYPDLYVQLTLFPSGAAYAQDDQMWKKLTPEQKQRVMRYVLARYAAYPQLFWLVTNDVHYGPKYPNNNAFAREVGEYFRAHDPWRHPMSTGHARGVAYYFGDEDWSSYIDLESNFDLGAAQIEKYRQYARPVFLGEDRYEQDHPADRDPKDMRYFQRRLFWAWLLAGGSANYGGRWWVLDPYTQTGQRPRPSPYKVVADGEAGKVRPATMHTQQLTGLDSVKAIHDYFEQRKIELSDFEPDPALARDLDGRTGAAAPKVMRRGADEFLVYHPNAASDDRTTRADAAKTARLSLDLKKAPGRFQVEWFRAYDGAVQTADAVEGGAEREFVAPWQGQDVVLRLLRK